MIPGEACAVALGLSGAGRRPNAAGQFRHIRQLSMPCRSERQADKIAGCSPKRGRYCRIGFRSTAPTGEKRGAKPCVLRHFRYVSLSQEVWQRRMVFLAGATRRRGDCRRLRKVRGLGAGGLPLSCRRVAVAAARHDAAGVCRPGLCHPPLGPCRGGERHTAGHRCPQKPA